MHKRPVLSVRHARSVIDPWVAAPVHDMLTGRKSVHDDLLGILLYLTKLFCPWHLSAPVAHLLAAGTAYTWWQTSYS